MDKQIYVDGHVYELVSEGIYECIDPYLIDCDEWISNRNHAGYMLITRVKGDNVIPYKLSINGPNHDNLDKWWIEHHADKIDGYDYGMLCCSSRDNILGGMYYESADS